jgi:hypothetical protein
LQHQSRTASSQGASIEKPSALRKHSKSGCCHDRSPPGGYSYRQHARAMAPSKSLTELTWRKPR